MFLMAVTTKSNFLKWILSVGIVLTFFSLSYFYSIMPTPDAQQFRGLTEYFIKTGSLDASHGNHMYYQWPAFFVLGDIVTSVSGLSLPNYEFLMYALIGVLLASTLYLYSSKKYPNGAVLMVAAFFISINYFINYQAVPFSLALVLLFLLFVLETRQKSFGVTITMLVLFAGTLVTHLFVPLFFVLYLLMRGLFDKNKQTKNLYIRLFLLGLVSYLLVQITLAHFSFQQLVQSITKAPAEYSSIASMTLDTSIPVQINIISQFFSRTVTITAIIICVAGLVLLLIKRKMNALDKSILLTGVVYSVLGTVLNTIGYRAIAIAFIPISLGAAFLFKDKFRPYLAGLFLVLIVLFFFVPIHQSFNTEVAFQTRETYNAVNFFINHYNWEKPSFVVTDFWTNTYLAPKLSVYVWIQTWWNIGYKADAVLYTPQFAGFELGNYTSMESFSQGEKLSVLYNNGVSYALIAPH
jgi:hypothetical protein